MEKSESLQLALRNPGTGAFIGSPAQAVLTILDNDVAQPVLLTEEGTARAVALDSVTMLREPFPLTNLFNFSLDRRTRVILFASGDNPLFSEQAYRVQPSGCVFATTPSEALGDFSLRRKLKLVL